MMQTEEPRCQRCSRPLLLEDSRQNGLCGNCRLERNKKKGKYDVDPEVLRRAYEDDPKATIASVAKQFGMSKFAVWIRLHPPPRPGANSAPRYVKKTTTPEMDAAMAEAYRAGKL